MPSCLEAMQIFFREKFVLVQNEEKNELENNKMIGYIGMKPQSTIPNKKFTTLVRLYTVTYVPQDYVNVY